MEHLKHLSVNTIPRMHFSQLYVKLKVKFARKISYELLTSMRLGSVLNVFFCTFLLAISLLYLNGPPTLNGAEFVKHGSFLCLFAPILDALIGQCGNLLVMGKVRTIVVCLNI